MSQPPERFIREFHYRIGWRPRAGLPGHHRGRRSGGGLEFAGHTSLLAAPDPRRVDLRASVRDPMQQLQVRCYHQDSAIAVYALADLTASMGFVGPGAKMDLLADFVATLAYSVSRTGDAFGFVAAADQPISSLLLPATRARRAGLELAQTLRGYQPHGSSAGGLLAAASRLGSSRALVFLLSDFHFPAQNLQELLTALSAHQVIPVILWCSGEYRALPRYGWVRLSDPESGRQRSLFMRPALRARIQRTFDERLQQLTRQFAMHGCKPLLLIDRLQIATVNDYFYA